MSRLTDNITKYFVSEYSDRYVKHIYDFDSSHYLIEAPLKSAKSSSPHDPENIDLGGGLYLLNKSNKEIEYFNPIDDFESFSKATRHVIL